MAPKSNQAFIGQTKEQTLIASLVVALLINVAPATNPPPVWNHPLPWHVYRALSDCETGSNLGHVTRSYVGAFGFAKGTWRLFSDTPIRHAKNMTYGQQAKVLDHAFWYGRDRPDGTRLWAVGPWGHGCFKMQWKTSPDLRRAVCHNGKQLVRRWCRK